MEKIIIIIPAYNEEKRIGATLDEYGRFFMNLKKNNKLNSEILVVINNTKDRTEAIVKKFKSTYKIINYLNFKQGGKGFAVKEGFKEAIKNSGNGMVGFVDADMSTKPDAFYDLIKNINNFDGVIASRYKKGSVLNPKPAFLRILAASVFNFFVRILFLMPYSDTQCGAKIFRIKAIDSIISRLGVTQWAFDVELLYNLRKQNYKIKELATVWEDKSGSKIKIFKSSIQMFFSIVRLRILHSKFVRLQKFARPLAGWLWRAVK